jgi:uncharacterized protein (TIGR02594 family)
MKIFRLIKLVVWAIALALFLSVSAEHCKLKSTGATVENLTPWTFSGSEFTSNYRSITPFQRSWEYYGVKEFANRDESIIRSFFSDVKGIVAGSETAWCSAFVNSMCIRSGYEFSNSLVARSWLDVGKETYIPKSGDIVVLWRKSRESWQGHVGFFLRYNYNKSKILMYGGNQSNAVVPQWYSADRILSFRRINPIFTSVELDGELCEYITPEQ